MYLDHIQPKPSSVSLPEAPPPPGLLPPTFTMAFSYSIIHRVKLNDHGCEETLIQGRSKLPAATPERKLTPPTPPIITNSHWVLIPSQGGSLLGPSPTHTGMPLAWFLAGKPQLLWVHEDIPCLEDSISYWRVSLVVEYISSLFLFSAKLYSIWWMCYNLAIHWSISDLHWTYRRLGLSTSNQG